MTGKALIINPATGRPYGVNIEDLATAETDPSLVLKPDGAGGVGFGAGSGGLRTVMDLDFGTIIASLPVWTLGTTYVAGTSVQHNTGGLLKSYYCILGHVAAAGNEPEGGTWETYWYLSSEFNANGSYVLPDGKVWTKENTDNEYLDGGLRSRIISGTGLIIQGHVGDSNMPTPSAVLLKTYLSQYYTAYHVGKPIRIWVYWSADIVNVNHYYVDIVFRNVSPINSGWNIGYRQGRGYLPYAQIATSWVNSGDLPASDVGGDYRVMCLDIHPHSAAGAWSMSASCYTGDWTGTWPDIINMNHPQDIIRGNTLRPSELRPQDWEILLEVGHGGATADIYGIVRAMKIEVFE